MKKLFTIALLLLLGSVLVAQESQKKRNEEEIKILLVLEKYIIANETQNLQLIEEIWATDEPIVAFGTDAGEKILGWEDLRNAYRRQFNSFKDTYISARNQTIRINETCTTAWFSQILNYNFLLEGVAKKYEGIRFTGVLVKKDGQWKLVQIHLSMPIQ
ncbi:MAG: nuclear transport factor 2 family protein [Bacteroidales bacterium]|nr:nuclear transport factor 2 family protein [Bacteroidales bacterium]MDZ4204755.1 nuclear transport factor 2 family protein [Bacteroidales bacterium]